MAVFVHAGNGKLSSRLQAPPTANTEWERDQIYLDLLSPAPFTRQASASQETSLHQAFSVLWEQFEGHEQQGAVCARLLAFHLLMERTRGQAAEDWLRQTPESPETVILDDAVVAAVGSVPLREDGRLLREDLASAVRFHLRTARRERSAHPCPCDRSSRKRSSAFVQ